VSPSLEEEVRLLSMVDVLEPLSKEELEELARRCPDREIEAGEFLYTPGDSNERLFALKRGRCVSTGFHKIPRLRSPWSIRERCSGRWL
jgi:hypothetical protein